MGKKQEGSDAHGPVGSRQTGKDGEPVTDGWAYERGSKSSRQIDMRNVGRHSLGDQTRGHKA